PQKPQKKLDPTQEAAQKEKKIRKIRREIKRLMKLSSKRVPVEEIDADYKLYLTKDQRQRKNIEMHECLSKQALDQWSRKISLLKRHEYLLLKNAQHHQNKALNHMKKHYPELYKQAVSIDQIKDKIFPIQLVGDPETPPIENYAPPDGDYKDVTKCFVDIGAEPEPIS
ncbi:MAG: 39S ribosomal protein L40, mitochondrial, partial [Paramarteilia canceri]